MVLAHGVARNRGASQHAASRTMRTRAAGAFDSTFANPRHFAVIIIAFIIVVDVVVVVFVVVVDVVFVVVIALVIDGFVVTVVVAVIVVVIVVVIVIVSAQAWQMWSGDYSFARIHRSAAAGGFPTAALLSPLEPQ